MRNILTFMWRAPSSPTPLIIDNEGMWFNIRNSCVSGRTRYWELWQHFCRECFEKLAMSIHLTDTETEVADILTKAMPKEDGNYKIFRNFMLNSGE